MGLWQDKAGSQPSVSSEAPLDLRNPSSDGLLHTLQAHTLQEPANPPSEAPKGYLSLTPLTSLLHGPDSQAVLMRQPLGGYHLSQPPALRLHIPLPHKGEPLSYSQMLFLFPPPDSFPPLPGEAPRLQATPTPTRGLPQCVSTQSPERLEECGGLNPNFLAGPRSPY